MSAAEERIIASVGVVGAGTMGRGIAQTTILAGVPTTLFDIDQTALETAITVIEQGLGRLTERDRISAEERDAARARLQTTTDLHDLANVEGVIEAASERLELKQSIFAELDTICTKAVFLASNTSSISVQEIARPVTRKELVLGMHYFNPAQILPLVEIVTPLTVSAEALAAAEALCRASGKTPIRVKDTPAFIVNRLFVPLALDAFRLVEAGVATAEDIDEACKLGLGHTQGPLATSDLVGLDVLLDVAESMFDELRDSRMAPPTLLRRLVSAGYLGRKSGRGVFDYSGE